ncbi:MAG: hypothetical protein IJ992_07480, partial [Lentisphaeria bacterium]|nr:hypothetical protein [Lentisphaeria bacterium]
MAVYYTLSFRNEGDCMINGTKNLTRGSMTGNLLVFAVPFLLANLVQAMYSAVDLHRTQRRSLPRVYPRFEDPPPHLSRWGNQEY